MSHALLEALKTWVEARITSAMASAETGEDGQSGSCAAERESADVAWETVMALAAEMAIETKRVYKYAE